MLKRTCQQFRENFESGGRADDPHLLDCLACEVWAQQLEGTFAGTFATAPQSPLPPGLAHRLQAIPQRLVLCRDVERLYSEARHRAAENRRADGGKSERGSIRGASNPDPAAAEHLASCRRCQSLYGVLESVLLEPPQPLPQRLLPRLTALVQRPSWTPSRWVQDARYAAAACFLLAASLTLVVEDATAALKQAKGSVQATTSTLAENVRARAEAPPGQEVWNGVTNSLEKSYLESRQHLSRLESSWRTFTHESLRELEALSQRLSQKYQTQSRRT